MISKEARKSSGSETTKEIEPQLSKQVGFELVVSLFFPPIFAVRCPKIISEKYREKERSEKREVARTRRCKNDERKEGKQDVKRKRARAGKKRRGGGEGASLQKEARP